MEAALLDATPPTQPSPSRGIGARISAHAVFPPPPGALHKKSVSDSFFESFAICTYQLHAQFRVFVQSPLRERANRLGAHPGAQTLGGGARSPSEPQTLLKDVNHPIGKGPGPLRGAVIGRIGIAVSSVP